MLVQRTVIQSEERRKALIDPACWGVIHWKPSRVKAHIAIAFTAYSLVRYLEYRVKLQYIKLSPEEIRRKSIGVQTSIPYDKSKRIRCGLPSRMSKHARKIYDILEITRRCTPYIIEKLRERIPSVLKNFPENVGSRETRQLNHQHEE